MPNSDFVQVATDGPGKKIDTVVLPSDATGTPNVERQGIFLGDPTTFANKARIDASGNLSATIPDGANVAQGATTDASSANTVIGLLKAVKALLTGTLTTSVSNFPGTQPVSGTVAVSNLPGTQPVSGTVAVSSLPGSVAQDGTDSSDANATQATAGVGLRGWLSTLVSLFRSGNAKVTINGTPAVSVSGSVATTLSGTPAVSVSNFPGTQAVSGTVTSNDGGSPLTGQSLPTGSGVIGWLSRLYVALTGTLTTNATIQGTPSVTVSGTSTVSGTVTSNDGGTAITGQSLQSGGVGVLGWLSQIYKAVAGTLTISGAVTNSNLDVALSTRLKPADTLAGVTTVAAVTAITNALPAGSNALGSVSVSNLPGTQPVSGTVTANAGTGNFNAKQVSQTSLTAALCSALTTTGAQTGQSLDGYDGAGTLQITAVGTVAAQAVSLQIEGSVDNSNWERIAIAQFGATDNPVYSTANFTLTPGASTISHLYAVRDTVKFVRVNATVNNLGTGLTVTYYSNPV